MKLKRYTAVMLRWLGLAVGLLLLAYFAYFALYGERGLLVQRTLEHDVTAAQEKLDQLKKEREAMQKRVQGLRPESLDRDLIDQQAREQLGLTRDGEQVIVTQPGQKKSD